MREQMGAGSTGRAGTARVSWWDGWGTPIVESVRPDSEPGLRRASEGEAVPVSANAAGERAAVVMG